MPERRRRQVRFDRPPIIEVVFGATFDPIPIQTVQVGKFWHHVRNQFPRFQDATPVNRVVEDFSGTDRTSLELLDMPELRRVWLLSEQGDRLVQIQGDRFLYNWKRVISDSPYPSFEKVFKQFEANLRRYIAFLASESLPPITYRQFELTYVNHIGIDRDESSPSIRVGDLLIDHKRDESRERFLPLPERFAWTSTYRLPGDQGRLHVASRSAVEQPSGRPTVRLDLTARGMPIDENETARGEWFEMAHEWVTQGFVDITDSQVQQTAWGRRQ